MMAAATARAQPSAIEAVEPASAAPASTYLQGGVMAGFDSDAAVGAWRVDGGYRLGESALWIHGVVADGKAAGIDETTMSSSYFTTRLGVEGRSCTQHGFACVGAGLDGGLRSLQLAAEYDHIDAVGAVIVPRIGVDLGGDHVRVAAGIELVLDEDGPSGSDATAGLAYRW
jgi:hypothetical protein